MLTSRLTSTSPRTCAPCYLWITMLSDRWTPRWTRAEYRKPPTSERRISCRPVRSGRRSRCTSLASSTSRSSSAFCKKICSLFTVSVVRPPLDFVICLGVMCRKHHSFRSVRYSIHHVYGLHTWLGTLTIASSTVFVKNRRPSLAFAWRHYLIRPEQMTTSSEP